MELKVLILLFLKLGFFFSTGSWKEGKKKDKLKEEEVGIGVVIRIALIHYLYPEGNWKSK